MKSKFVPPSDPTLSKVAQEISQHQINSSETRKIIQTMMEVAQGQQKNKRKPIMVGLAAPQIGISKRIILVDIKADGKGRVGDLRVYINPEIIWKSKKEEEWYEGCYSTGNVCGIVKRPLSIKIKGFKQKYHFVNRVPIPYRQIEKVEETHTGYVARIFQHEIDHLNGMVFVNHIKEPDKLHWVEKSEFPIYRNKQAWRNWPKKCTFKKWGQIKNPGVST